MTIRYRYAAAFTPPAPFVQVTIRDPVTGRHVADIPAHVDTAADRTILPKGIIAALGLVEFGRLSFQGFGSEVLELPIYVASIMVHDLPPLTIKAALGEGEPFVLLGRDVLNTFRILLDGPALALEIG